MNRLRAPAAMLAVVQPMLAVVLLAMLLAGCAVLSAVTGWLISNAYHSGKSA